MMLGGGDSHDYDDCNVGDNNDDDDDNDDRRLAKEPEYQDDAKKNRDFQDPCNRDDSHEDDIGDSFIL